MSSPLYPIEPDPRCGLGGLGLGNGILSVSLCWISLGVGGVVDWVVLSGDLSAGGSRLMPKIVPTNRGEHPDRLSTQKTNLRSRLLLLVAAQVLGQTGLYCPLAARKSEWLIFPTVVRLTSRRSAMSR